MTLVNAFLKVTDMSSAAAIIIVAVILLRLLLKRAPRICSYVLWAAVLFRLICPFSVKLPVRLTGLERIDLPSPIAAADVAVRHMSDVIGTQSYKVFEPSASIGTDWRRLMISVASYAWLAGMLAMAAFAFISALKMKSRLNDSVPVRDNIRMTDSFDVPFVLGIFRPRIYIPASVSDDELEYIVVHETRHINRGDHWWCLLAFAALCVHWFNPLVWLAFFLSRKDMELSCDEAVIKDMDSDGRALYSQTLLRLASAEKKSTVIMPPAFGKNNTKERIINIMKYKRPVLWVSVVSAVLCICAVTVFAFSSSGSLANPWTREYVPGDGYCLGNVDKEWFEAHSTSFAIGAGRDGVAVFKDPGLAWKTFKDRYADAIERVRQANKLEPIGKSSFEMYKVYGWQTDGKTAFEREENAFVTMFLDIYENSFTVNKGARNTAPTTQYDPELTQADMISALEDSIQWWTGDNNTKYVGFKLPSGRLQGEMQLEVSGIMAGETDSESYAFTTSYDRSQWEADRLTYIMLTDMLELELKARMTDKNGNTAEYAIDLMPRE